MEDRTCNEDLYLKRVPGIFKELYILVTSADESNPALTEEGMWAILHKKGFSPTEIEAHFQQAKS